MACRQLHIREITVTWRCGAGRTLAKFDRMISQDCLGVLRGITRTAASVVHENLAAAEGKVREQVPPREREGRFSHGLKLVDALLGVALSDLAKRFVFVSACFHVLGV